MAPPPLLGQEKKETCALACLRMILAQHGNDVTEATLGQEVNLQPGGIAIEDLKDLAPRHGLQAEILRLDLSAVARLTAEDVYPIVYLNRVYFGMRFPLDRRRARRTFIVHAVIVVRVSPTFVTFLDPLPPGKRRRISRRKFVAAWQDLNNWCLVCRPP